LTAWGPVPSFAAAARCNDRCRSALHLAWLTLSISLATGALRAQAEAPSALEIVIEAESCPHADLLKSMLAPLLSEAILLSAEQLARPDARRVRVRDLGLEYAIELEHTERRQRDPERNCEERARVAAVFIALNVNPKRPAEADTAGTPNTEALAPSAGGAPATSSTRPASSTSNSADRPARSANVLHVGLGAFASVMFAPQQTAVAPGGGATVWLELSALRLALSAALMGKVALPLSPREPGGSAELWRVPLAANVGYLWRASRFALAPSLGIALDVLRMQGRGLGQSEHALRVNVGVDLELLASVSLRDRLALLASVSGAWFPRGYELRVEPAPRRAEAPELWLAGQLGIAFMLR
jgi:hypothetical protein